MSGEEEPKPLSHEILSNSLSEIKMAVGGGGYVFTKLDCTGQDVTNLGNKIEFYEHIRHITLASNKIVDIASLTKLPHLLTLSCEGNAVTSLKCLTEEGVTLPWLQRINFSGNKLTALPSLAALERLRFAYFGENEIESLEEFGDHPTLEELHLQKNKLTTLKGMGALEKLNLLVLSENTLDSLEGLNVPEVKMLNLAGNQLANLESIGGAPNCVELDLSGNKLSTENPNLPELKKLAELKKLRSLKIAGNTTDPLKLEALYCIRQLKTIDDEPITDEDKQGAKDKKAELLAAIKEYEEKLAAAEGGAAEEATG